MADVISIAYHGSKRPNLKVQRFKAGQKVIPLPVAANTHNVIPSGRQALPTQTKKCDELDKVLDPIGGHGFNLSPESER